MIKLENELTENFKLSEFTKSATAKKLKIDNTPNMQVWKNLKELCVEVLQPLRDYCGYGLTISSGYRCPALNSSIKGSSPTSAHKYGFAADIVPPTDITFDEFKKTVLNFFKEHEDIKYDQVIIESDGQSKWIHIGYKNGALKQRMMLFSIDK